ncbi:MAG: hypothetical protein J0H29_07815 [Sphingobacteriales bacterium]|nr:hypothetical protein [Sphingobacteriales bacterium]
MTKNEILRAIEDLKWEMVLFQKTAEELQFSEEDKQKQIDIYLDTMNKVKDQLKKVTD